MAGIPEIIDRDEMEGQVAARLAELESLMQEAEKLRRRQILTAVCTVLLMLVVLFLFIAGLAAYFRAYPKGLLVQEVVKQNRLILANPYYVGLNPKYDRRLAQYFLAEMRRERQARRPMLRHAVRSGIRSLQEFSGTELREVFQNQLYARLNLETRRITAGTDFERDARRRQLRRQLNAALAAEITRRLFDGHQDALRQECLLFHQETEALRHSSMFRELEQEPLETVEEKMFENLLECLVCRLNENRAAGGDGR